MNGLGIQLSPAVRLGVIVGLLLLVAYLIGTIVATDNLLPLSLLTGELLLLVTTWQQRFLVYAFVIACVWFYGYFSYTQTPLLYIGANVYLGDLFIFMFLGSTLILALSKEGHCGLRSPVGVAIALYLTWGIVCVVRGIPVWGHSALGESRFIMWACVYFPVVYSVRDMQQLKRMLGFFLFLVFSYLIYLETWRYLVQFRGDIGSMLRSKELIGVDLALLVVSIFVFSLSLILSGGSRKHKFGIIALALISGAIVPFGARTGWIALAVSTAFLVFILFRRANMKAYFIFLIVLATLATTFVSLDLFSPGGVLDPGAERGLGFLTEEGRLWGTTAWRLFGWENLLRQTMERDPILGEGFGGYYDIFEYELRGVPPHNDWLVILSKMGAVGLILFIAIVVQFYRIGFRFIRETAEVQKRAYMLGLLCVFLLGLVGGFFFAFYPFMWIAAGLQTALIKISSTSRTNPNGQDMALKP